MAEPDLVDKAFQRGVEFGFYGGLIAGGAVGLSLAAIAILVAFIRG